MKTVSLAREVNLVHSSLESLRRIVSAEQSKNSQEKTHEGLGLPRLASQPEMSEFYSRVQMSMGQTGPKMGFYKFVTEDEEYFVACPLKSTENFLKKILLFLLVEAPERVIEPESEVPEPPSPMYSVEFFNPKTGQKVGFSSLRSFEMFEVRVSREPELPEVKYPSRADVQEITSKGEVHCLACSLVPSIRKLRRLEGFLESLKKLSRAYAKKEERFGEEKGLLGEKLESFGAFLDKIGEELRQKMNEENLFEVEKELEDLEEKSKREFMKIQLKASFNK
jgi:hypothetical protein